EANLAGRIDRWADVLAARKAWLDERGIRYLVVAAPDKQSIYPEFLPRLARRHGPAPLDQLLDRCRRDPNLTILDLREPLRGARPAGPLYLLNDSHWSPAGVYASYASTVQALDFWQPKLTPAPPTEFATQPVQFHGGDLARLLGLADECSE